MDKGAFASAWPSIRDRVKTRWSKLTSQELDSVQGNPELLIGMIQEKYDESRQAIDLQLKSLVEQKASPR